MLNVRTVIILHELNEFIIVAYCSWTAHVIFELLSGLIMLDLPYFSISECSPRLVDNLNYVIWINLRNAISSGEILKKINILFLLSKTFVKCVEFFKDTMDHGILYTLLI